MLDAIDARLILALTDRPRSTVVALAEQTGLTRNTVQARLTRLDEQGVLTSFERRVDPTALGYPLTAFITTTVTQRRLDEVAAALEGVPEIVEVFGLSGQVDLLIRVVAVDADDLYRIAGQILATPGVQRTNTALVMRRMVDFRLTPLLRKAAARQA
ncbi:MAG: transcriptional regulator, AsnC family [Pseudonocardia sp.]|nr:transcriptional regulator, AsnC family [Pseudonocardia sp.]